MELTEFTRLLHEDIEEEKASKDGITLIEIERLEDFPTHDFPLYEGVRLDALVESVKKFGILQPLLVTKKDSKMFVILSGHNRKRAAQIAEIQKLPCRVMSDLSQEEQELIVRETNLQQRSFSELTHKQKALCLAAHYELMKRQGYRTDLTDLLLKNTQDDKNAQKIDQKNAENSLNQAENGTCVQIEHKLKSREQAGKEFGLSAVTFQRYVRIAKLTEKLLDMLDDGHLKINAAYTLSFIDDEDAQENIVDYIKGTGKKLSIGDAEKLRARWEKYGVLTADDITAALSTEKKDEKKKSNITINRAAIRKYIKDDIDQKEAQEIIIAALEAYFAKEVQK